MSDLHELAAAGGSPLGYYVSEGGRQQGPFTVEQFRRTGIAPDVMVWADGLPEWRRADQVPALAGVILRPTPPMGSPQQADRIWTVHDQGRQYGPHTLTEIAMLVGVGTITSAAMAWRAGSPQWEPVSSLVPMPAGGMAHAPHAPAGGGNRVAAGIFGILLGGLGIHKFILGYPTAGIIMLLVTVCSCGWGWLVMGVIGIAEGIIYLTKSDAEFHQMYVARRKEWF
jgi:TM2 domain-containing membrane protein YozV